MDVVLAHSPYTEDTEETHQWLLGNRSCTPTTALRSARDAETVINTIVALFGLPMTLLVLVTQLLSNRIYRPSTPILYLTNLYFANLITTALIPFLILSNRGYASGTMLGCKLVSLAYYASCTASFATLILISVNRYRVLHQRTRPAATPRRRTYGILACTWLAAILCAAPSPLYTTTMLRPRERGAPVPACVIFFEHEQVKTLLAGFKILLCLFWGVAPVIMMSWFYLFFYRRLRLASCRRRSQTLVFISTLMVSFLVLQTPYIVILAWESYAVLSWEISCDSIVARDASAVVARVIPHLHCLLNPILYAFLGRDFKQRLGQCLRGELLNRRRALRVRAGVRKSPPSTSATAKPSWTSNPPSGESQSWSLSRALTQAWRRQGTNDRPRDPVWNTSASASPASPGRGRQPILTLAALRQLSTSAHTISRDPPAPAQKVPEPSATPAASSVQP